MLVTSRAICKVSGPADLGRSTLIAFAQGCSYRRRTEEWLGSANVMPERIMEFESYQAMIPASLPVPGLLWCPSLSWRPCARPRAYANTRSLSDFRTTAPLSCGMAIHRRRCGACYRFWTLPPYDGSLGPPAHLTAAIVKGFGRRRIATVRQALGSSSESPQGRNPRGVEARNMPPRPMAI